MNWNWLELFIKVQAWGGNGNGWHNQVICRWYSLIYDMFNKLKSFLSNNNFGSKSRFHSLGISNHNIDYVSWTHVLYDSLGGRYWCSVVCVYVYIYSNVVEVGLRNHIMCGTQEYYNLVASNVNYFPIIFLQVFMLVFSPILCDPLIEWNSI